MQNNLIYEVGFCDGEDTYFYLRNGYSVVAIDANPHVIYQAKISFQPYITSGSLRLVHRAISQYDKQTSLFYISSNTLWSSLQKQNACRHMSRAKCIHVKTTTLAAIFNKYGTPYYCKIDLEGAESLALESIAWANATPKYISVEVNYPNPIQSHKSTDTLQLLHKLGYTKFKLIDQETLSILQHGVNFYQKQSSLLFKILSRAINRLNIPSTKYSNRLRLANKFGYKFPYSASGPFGEDLDGEWLDYSSAMKLISYHIRSFYQLANNKGRGFWCDWHAKK